MWRVSFDCCVVADWRDFEEMTPRHDGKHEMLDELTETWTNVIAASSTASTASLKSTSTKHIRTFQMTSHFFLT